MEVEGLKEFIIHSTSKSFIALCGNGREWVIRCKKKTKIPKDYFQNMLLEC
jgi:hypothetical protein